jgi:hypothetical protein
MLSAPLPAVPDFDGSDPGEDLLDRIERVLDALESAVDAGDPVAVRQGGEDLALLVLELKRSSLGGRRLRRRLLDGLQALVAGCAADGAGRDLATGIVAARGFIEQIRTGSSWA